MNKSEPTYSVWGRRVQLDRKELLQDREGEVTVGSGSLGNVTIPGYIVSEVEFDHFPGRRFAVLTEMLTDVH